MKKYLFQTLFFLLITTVSAQTAGTLTVSATVGSTSKYYYAVWINNPSGTFLRTLTMLGYNTSYYKDMANWSANSGKNLVNATTGATLSAVAAYTTTWNAKDQANSAVVADGTYTIRIEMTTESFGTNSKCVTTTFTKGPVAQTVTPTAISPIAGISIKWVPVNTAVNDVEIEKLYNVYPSQAVSSIYVTGTDVKQVEICSLAGKSILISNNEQKVDISALPKGLYLVVVTAKAGTIVRKIQKI